MVESGVYSVLFVDPSRIRREKMAKSLLLAKRELKLHVCELGHALFILKKENPGLDAVVATAAGWREKQKDFDRMLGLAVRQRIPTILVLGSETVSAFDMTNPRYQDTLLYKDPLDLATKLKRKLDKLYH